MRFPLTRTLAACLALLPTAALAADPVSPAMDMIRTPPAPDTPRINGARVYGARPGHPFFYHVPVTGERPVTVAATGLPAGLTLDPATGNITGTVADPGEHKVALTVTNAKGKDSADLKLVIGDTICLTPPMGFNSWNHFAGGVTEKNMREAADAMVASGLIDHGWTYVNVDDCWQAGRDPAGNILSNERFPDFKGLADYIHAKGLKFGVYSSPGPKTCARYTASYQHEDQDAATYAKWGVDYVKYDLCSYGDIINEHLRTRTAELLAPEQREHFGTLATEKDALQSKWRRTPEENARLKVLNDEIGPIVSGVDPAKSKAMRLEEEQLPYRVFQRSLAKVPRDIVYSFCQYGNANSWEWAADLGGNCWRTTGDISANWRSMSNIGFNQDRLAKFAKPGHWNDPDMLEVGNKGLTPDECYTHMTLWCMLASPLLIGCDMSKMDPLTVSMFSNDEVLAVNQDALGQQGHRIKKDGTSEVWVKPLSGQGYAVALFNRGEQPAEIGTTWGEVSDFTVFASKEKTFVVRDLWRQRAQSHEADGVTMTVAPHSAELLLLGPKEHVF